MEPYTSYTEKELLLLVAKGDEAAFTHLFHTWHPLLSTFILRMTRSASLTEEVVQEVFVKIWMSREALQYVERFKPYLWVITRHHAIDALRKTATRTGHEKQYQQLLDTIQPDLSDQHDYHTMIDEAIAMLPPKQQQVYLLSRRDRMKQADIAKLMGISLATVKSYMQLAVAFITRYIKDKAGLGAVAVALLKIFS